MQVSLAQQYEFLDDDLDDMKLRKEDQDWLTAEISRIVTKSVQDSVDQIQPTRWKRVSILVKDLGGAGVIVGIFVALLGIALAATYVAVARVEKQATFESNTTNSLNGIGTHLQALDSELSAIRLARIAENPATQENVAAVRKLLATATKDSLKIPLDVVQQAGAKFVEASAKSPPAWAAAVAFVDYRSYLNGPAPKTEEFYPLDGVTPQPPGVETTHHVFGAVPGKAEPRFTTSIKRVPIAISARSEKI